MAKNATEYVVEEDFDINARPQTDADSPVIKSWGITTEGGAGEKFAVDFKFTEDPQIIRFHADSFPPFSYKEHWLSSKTSGKRSYVCLNPKNKPDLSCPLCEMDANIPGQTPKVKTSFTVANFSAAPFQRQLMTGSKRLVDALFAMDSKENFGPLEGKYWAVSRSGEKQNIAYHLTPVKERDLLEDWKIDPAKAKEFFDAMTAYEPSIIKSYSQAELLEVAQSL